MADPSGRVRGRAAGGPANPGAAGPRLAWRRVASVLRDALTRAGADPARTAACLALAGWDREPLRAELLAAAAELGLGGPVVAVPDFVAAWAGAGRYRPGVAVVAGTGSVAYGRSASGAEARSGGWGPLFGDEGGGADLGRRAVAAALRAADGRGPATALTALLCRALGVRRAEDAVGLFPWRRARPDALAALGPLVFEAAAGGDAVAETIVGGAAAALGELAAAVVARLGLEAAAAPVSGCGGLLAAGTPLSAALEADLRRRGLPGLRAPALPPVGGAVLLAHAAGGGDPAEWALLPPDEGG